MPRNVTEAVSAPEIDLVVTDLDGTLWDAQGRVHPDTLEALRTLAVGQIPVLAATGRRAGSAWPLMESNGIALPSVLLDGAIGREFAATTAFHRRSFTRDSASEVLGILDGLGVSPCINLDEPGRDVVLGDRRSVHPKHLIFLEPWLREEDPWTAVETLTVLAFTFVGGEPSMMRHLAAELTTRAPVAASVYVDRTYGGLGLSLRPPGTNKWEGVVAFCGAHGCDPSRVLAIGDSENDLELLDGAAVAFVVADGSTAALERADHVVAPASDGGWAGILEVLGLSPE